MKVLRVIYYIAFVLFILLIAASSVVGLFLSPSEKKLQKMFPDPDFVLSHETYGSDGILLDYYAIGPDTAQRIIFLHGSPGSWDNFAEIMSHRELYSTHRLIAVNRIGYGASRLHNGVASLDAQVNAVLPLIRNSKGGRKPVLAGHSMGGPIVIRAAMLHSEKLTGVISLAGSLDAKLEPDEWFRGLYKVFPINLFMASSLKSSNDELFTHYKELESMSGSWDRIRCAVYIVQGLSDDLVDKGNADYAEKKLVNAGMKKIIRIPGENHFLVWTRDSVLAAYILELADQ